MRFLPIRNWLNKYVFGLGMKTAPDIDQLTFDFIAEAPRPDAPPPVVIRDANFGPLLVAEHPPANDGFLTEAQVSEIFLEAARKFRREQVRQVFVRFKPFRATLYSFKINRSGVADCKLHLSFRCAGEEVLRQAAMLMLCRGNRARHELDRTAYDAFVRAMPQSDFNLPGSRKGRRVSDNGPGRYRSLEESFARINRDYFNSQLKQPELCWSPVRARRILGSYHHRNDRLIISRVFDSPRVPTFVLDYLMFHELLHKFLGIGTRDDGRRCVHGPEFRALEQKFKHFEAARAFLEKL